MAGMFYSLQDAAEKLGKTEEELKRMVKQGKLREFRDGPHLLFKTEEVEALLGDTAFAAKTETPEPEPLAGPAEPELELAEIETPQSPETPTPEQPEIELPELEALLHEGPAPAEPGIDTEEILLAPETGAPAPPSELTNADTALTGEGVSVLGETDKDYKVTDDTMAETMASTGTTGVTPELSLEEIEEDVKMDTFGSGSGLLDLSLQADDTSLGAILDEIYAGEGAEAPARAAPVEEEAAPLTGEPAEAGEIPEEELVPLTAPGGLEVATVAPAYIELEPDTVSNTLGMLLFLPLALLLYTAVVAVAGLKGVMPSILAKAQGIIWYIMLGMVVLAGAVVGAAFMLSGDLSLATKKEKKPKEPKKPKASKKTKKGKETPPEAEETAT
jgi:excisionase family DNA binding protein